MSLFLISVAALIALALLLLLPTLVRRKTSAVLEPDRVDARRANLRVLREQLAAVDAEHAGGALDAEQYRLARIEIERRVLDEEAVGERPAVAVRAGKTALALGLIIPLFVFGVYALVGSPQALAPASEVAVKGHPDEPSRAQIESMVDQLAQRLEGSATKEAGDPQAWTMLARSYAVMQRFPESSRAYGRARALAPGDAQLLADHADVLAMLQGKKLAGEPALLIAQALQIDPKNIKALALSGSAAFEREDFKSALNYWGQAQQLTPPGSEFAAGLENSMQQTRAAMNGTGPSAPVLGAGPSAPVLGGGPNVAVPPPAAPGKTSTPGVASANGAVTGAQTSGVVQLAGALANRVAPTDTVFVFARAAQGPRMPLAILKHKVSELPLAFALDDSTAMSPELKLSAFPSVVISARISRSGDATPRSGDLVGQIGPLNPGSNKLVVVIDRVQP